MSSMRRGRIVSLLAVALLLVVVIAATLGLRASLASGDEASGSAQSVAPTALQTKEALESGKATPLLNEPETDLHAAQTLPHRDLERGEALELAEAVFEPEIEGIGGIYQEIEPERYLSDNTAIIDPASMPEGLAGPQGEDLAVEHPDAGVVVESTLPLRTENVAGETEAVDLGLEHSEGELQPQNPVAEVGFPLRLGEGISLPGPEVEITIANAPESRVATDAEGQFAFYPEIAESTDLIASPAPRGLEVMTDVRSAEAPRQTTYELSLPQGAELRSSDAGGAEVVADGRSVVVVPAPRAIDAAGNAVQVELTVSGSEMTVTTTPDLSTAYPVLVDPTFETSESWSWAWNHDTEAQWIPSTTNVSAMNAWTQTRAGTWGLDLTSGLGGNGHPLDNANWDWVVPRYLQDLSTYKEPPSTWVYGMQAEGVFFTPYGNFANYPALVLGLVSPGVGWATMGVHYGGQGEMNSWTNHFSFANPSEMTDVKSADMNLVTYEEEDPSKVRDTYVSSASVVYVDNDAPVVLGLNPPTPWVSAVTAPASYEFQDKGLGMKYGEVIYNGSVLTQVSLPCDGRPLNPCPRRLTQAQQPLTFSTATLPTGRDWVTVTGSDPVFAQGVPGHSASGTMLVKVDHTAPEVSLSGSLTEQGALGTRLPTYPLRVGAKDGTSAAPQSGIKKVEVKVDGAPVPMAEPAEWEPNCQTENCQTSAEWALNSSAYAAGPHEVQVIATDAVGNTTTKTLQIELRHPAPTLTVSGSLTEQATLGGELPSYKLKIAAAAQAESPPAAGLPTYSSSFGTSGAGNGQFAHPGDVAIGTEGNLFVVDTNNNRIEKFSAGGTFISQFGTKGSGNGQLNRPTAIAVTAYGNLWVTDSGNKRVEAFTPAGSYIAKFGAAGTGAGQFAGSGPEGIAIDYHGNIWVSDTYGGRLEKFGEAGNFIRSVGTKGTAYEQLGQPTALEAAPGGQIYVTDWEDDKVAEYGEGGAFIRQFGSQGNEPGQLQQPTGIAIDSRGDVWVGDQGNQRVEEFNQAGEYLRRFGAEGSGAGQFRLQYPIGIATDTVGDIWVTDPLDNRVEKWVSTGYASEAGPTLLRSFGSGGTGNGQFTWAVGAATDAKGSVWAGDFIDGRVEKFNEKGEYLTQFGTPGTGNGQFTYPFGISVDPKGHVWVADDGNNRVEEFSEAGAWMRTVVGSGGAFKGPQGISTDSKGDLWVADSGNGRIEEFGETGSFIRSIGTKGTGKGQLAEPSGVAVTAAGNVWVSDSGNQRLVEFTEAGGVIREVGGSGSTIGKFNAPVDIAVDPAGNPWVVDELNHRIQEFNGQGEFVRQFGAAGTGPGQFENAMAIAFDGKGHAFVTDRTNNRVTEWTLAQLHSQISSEITVDGRRVDATEAGCSAEVCPLSREWTLNASVFTPGSHAVVIRATDGLGNTTTKTLNVKTGDETKPGLEVGGELFAAPEGWVQQKNGSYGFNASATDKGFGVTALRLKIDGKSVASKEQSCSAGKCSASISTSVNVKELAAGAHEGEVVATDGAGNASVNKWTVNVDPEGVISNEELAATAEAMEGSSGSPILAAAEEIPGVEGSTGGVGLVEGEEPGTLQATGTYVPMTVSGETKEGFELHVAGLSSLAISCDEVEHPESEGCVPRSTLESAQAAEEKQIAEGLKYPGMIPITVKPAAIGSAATEQELLGEHTAGSANAGGEEWDTFTRPLSDGGWSFANIRGPEAPEHYVYEMELDPELQLRQPDSQHMEFVYWKYGVVAGVISAEHAHDMIGSTVPTHLSISGPAKVTLTVEHRGASPAGGHFVYPVLGGAGWQGGFRTVTVELTEPPSAGESPEEESWPGEGEETIIGPPEPSTPQEAGITNLALLQRAEHNTSRHLIEHIRCEPRWEPAPFSPRAGETLCGNPFTHQEASERMALNFGIQGYIYVSPGNFVRHRGSSTNGVKCGQELFPKHWGKGEVLIHPEYYISQSGPCEWLGYTLGDGGQEVGPGHHLCLYGEWTGGENGYETFGTAGFVESLYGNAGYRVTWYKTIKYRCHRP